MNADNDDDSLVPPDSVPSLPHWHRAKAPRRGIRAFMMRWFFGSSVIVAAISALLMLNVDLPQVVSDERRALAATAFALIALLSLAGLRVRRPYVEAAVASLLVTATLVIAFAAVLLGWGLTAPGIGFFGLFACMTCVAAGERLGVLVAAVAALALFAVQWAHLLLPGLPATPVAPSGGLQLPAHLLQIAVGLVGGITIARVTARYVRSADDREQRFRGLLAIAADAYWEIDQQYRLVEVTNQRDDERSLRAEDGIGEVPWELPQFICDAETLDQLQADLDGRLPFRDLSVHWQMAPSEPPRCFVVSGEPRFDERGVFLGYWGVARDITADLAAREALTATETRYQDLFSRIPTPLVMHRDGFVIDANPAGVALLGYKDLAEMIGRDMLSSFESGDSRERARRRLDEVTTLAVGEGLPVADYRLLLASGRRVSVRATAVRVDVEGGPAVLSIFIDDTERHAAEDAVRRSEAMLSHLVATSPDVITLTDLGTGRYAMVNRTFERLVGWRADEVIGKTSIELGVWHRAEDRARMLAELQARGSVQNLPTNFVAKGGQVVQMLVSAARFSMDRRDYLVINARDVTETERARLEREAILENASIGIAVTRDRRFVLANPFFERMYGWPVGGLVGQPGHAVWPDEAAYAEIGAVVGPALARGEQVEIERPVMRRDRSSFLGRIVGKAIDPTRPAQGGTVWIVEDVTERRQFEATLSRARDDAEAASRAKSAFLANTSHELRTPLNGMLGLAQLARAPGVADDTRQQYLDQIADSARSLAEVITDILDLSKIEAGKLLLESLDFDLGDMLRTLHRAYDTLATARGLRLTLDLSADVDGFVRGDPLRVRQILSNFLGNAIKFTSQGEVRLRARRVDAGQVRLEVSDTGIGIDAQSQSRLFQPFSQADDSTTRRFGGTGLGLSICRELATLMGGEVGVTSAAGQGSVFWAQLPLAAAVAPPVVVADRGADDRILRDARVLLVEDNPVNMMIATAMLERWGVQVTQAFDGQQAVEAVQRGADKGMPFGAVLMDIQMPVMSGHEATRVLRTMAAGQSLPIIALTAAALVSEREQALQAGMDDFMTKPIDADRLRSALTRWLAGRQAS